MTFRSIAVVSAVALTLAALEVVANERSIRAALDAELPGIGIGVAGVIDRTQRYPDVISRLIGFYLHRDRQRETDQPASRDDLAQPVPQRQIR